MKRIHELKSFVISVVLFLFGVCPNLASAAFPMPGQMNLQPAASPAMMQLVQFHDFLLVFIFAVSAFVLVLLTYVCFRFNKKANPVPSKVTHNTLIEVIWTVVPVLILIAIAIPSFRLLFVAEQVPESEMTIKVIGHQWYWEYNYPDNGDFSFDSYMIKDEDLKPGQKRLLDVDNPVVLPIDTTVRVQITSADVIHNWAMPSMAIKKDAVPGRLSETWLRISKPGMYYGQCSELCGVNHGFMPIAIRAVTKEEYTAWVEQAKEQFASGGAMQTVASLESRR